MTTIIDTVSDGLDKVDDMLMTTLIEDTKKKVDEVVEISIHARDYMSISVDTLREMWRIYG